MSDFAPEPFERELERDRATWKLLAWLVAGAAFFVIIDYLGNRSGWVHSFWLRRIFNIGREDSLHNFVSSVQELAVAGVALIAYLHARRTARRSEQFEWGVAFALLTWIGVDDGSALHERIGSAIEEGVSFFPSYAWQVLFVPLFTLGLAVTYHVVSRTRKAPYTRVLFIAAFACYVIATGLDYTEGRDGAFESIASFLGVRYGLVSHYSRVIEEFLEDVGASLLLVVVLRHLLWTVPSLRIVVTGAPRQAAAPYPAEPPVAPPPADPQAADLPPDPRYS